MNKEKYLKTAAIIGILLIAGFFRFYQLDQIPPGLYPDVAINGNDAINANYTGDYKIFYPDNNGREGFFINLIAYSFNVFGPSVWAIKIVAAIIGFLTVIGLYLLANELFKNWRIAALSSFLMSISFWHVNFSRIGFRAIMTPFALTFLLYFLLKAFKTKKFYWFGFAGIFFALGFYTYISYRIAPLIVFVFIAYEFLKDWQKDKNFKNILIKNGWWKFVIFFFLFFTITIYPLFDYFQKNPQDFIGRAGQVSVFSAENPVKEIIISAAKTFGMFNIWGDCNWRHNYNCQPQLLWPIGILFLIGFYFASKQFYLKTKNKNYLGGESEAVIFVFWWIMLIPSILSAEGLPHALRSIGAIPPTFIFAGIGAYYILTAFKNLTENNRSTKIIYFAVIAALLGSLTLAEFNKYFLDWGRHTETAGAFEKDLTNLGKRLSSLPINIKKIVIINEGGVLVKNIPMPAQTVMFMVNSDNWAGMPIDKNIYYILPEQLENILQKIDRRESIFITSLSSEPELLSKIKKILPETELTKENGVWAAFKY